VEDYLQYTGKENRNVVPQNYFLAHSSVKVENENQSKLVFGHSGGLKRYSVNEDFSWEEAAYIIQQVDSFDMVRIAELQKQGFQFHERFLYVEINLKATSGIRNRLSGSVAELSLEMGHQYTNDLYELAYKSFETDRRFHLEQQFDQHKAKDVKEAYINRCKEQGMTVFSARRADELLGYIIVDLHPNQKAGCFQIMLGVTKAGIKGKMAAIPLYNGLLDRMFLSEGGGYVKYCGYISSTNTASLNLHYQLGAKAVQVIDEYIYRVGRGEDG